MAKLQFFDLLGDESNISAFYTEQMMTLDEEPSNSKTAHFLDMEQDTEIVFKGTGFSYEEGNIATGTVKSIQFLDGDGEKFATLKGDDTIIGSGKFDILDFGQGNNKGDDVIDGGDSADQIAGGLGKDTLTGGKGNDYFIFFKGDGKDVITDFDAIGGDGKQDIILQTFGSKKDISIEKSGDDVVIDFGGGSTLTLLDVKRSDISMQDFGNM
jgi:Ca2+-binding RTX toxin-like protein